MPLVQNNTLDLIGNTPLVLLQGPSAAAGCEIWGKCEFANPGASVKDRAALWIIRDAEARGELKPGAYADVIAFDPARFAPRADYARPTLLTQGMQTVVVNGQLAIENGAPTGLAAGQPLPRQPRPGSCPAR